MSFTNTCFENFSGQQAVSKGLLRPNQPFPLVIEPAMEGVDLISWVKDYRESVESHLLKEGAILFRSFKIDSPAKFEQFVTSISADLLEYFDQHTPRTRVSRQIFTSTEYPAKHTVPFHSENSKNQVWPMKIWFGCLQPALQGGETPLADNRRVFALIDPKIKERFIEKKVMYVRNFGDGFGLPWQKAFQTTDPALVEQHCREAHMECHWKDHNRLHLSHVCQAISRHPKTREVVWFNQAHLFHVSSVGPEATEALLEVFKEEDLPSNSYYGDGTRIETSVLDEIREAFRQSSVSFPWRTGDVLMLENMLIAHGRAPFSGPRKIIVAMADPFSVDQQITSN
jgi:alpha-ketoglutarate-dependent taurine dioxygenase